MTDFYGEIFGNFSCPSPRQTLVPVLWVQFHALLTCDYKSELISIQIFVKSGLNGLNGATRLVVLLNTSGAPNDNFRKIICSENDLRSRIFGSFSVKFLACLLLLGFSNIKKKWNNCPFLTDFYPKKVTYNFREPFFWLKFSER